MGDVDTTPIEIASMNESQIADFLKEQAMSLKVSEAKKIVDLIGRNPTLTELHIFNIQWSEHSSYKSSRDVLKQLPTAGKDVILGPSEDAGITFFTEHEGERYGIVMSHESHNHPSQVVPFEGAATGIGGNVRDVLCMGARVISCADPLRFGDPFGKNKRRVKYIANQVIDGIAGYGNPLGIPVIAGDMNFNSSFDDNCLVNVVTLGLVKEKDIIHSYAPKNAEGWDIIVVGKATDNSGFGGAAFASVILDEDDKESNRGAVQVPDPFLKNVLIRSTEAVFKEVRAKKMTVGFKDMGAGGIMCATTELVASAGFGAEIDVDKIHVSMKNLPPFVIACSETQERFTWIVPKDFTDTVLKIYNEDFELPKVSEGARASVVGRVTKNPSYILKHNGKVVCNADATIITEGIKYQRPSKKPHQEFSEVTLDEPSNYEHAILKVLQHPNVASKALCHKHYDTEVQGLGVIRAGEADAGVQTPIPNNPTALALSVDSNPLFSRINPYLGAAHAVAEAMRNVASVGATPVAMTDCLNYGNPEKPEQFWQFTEGVRGLKDAATNLCRKGTNEPVPFVGGNVSFYNESSAGNSVDPSAIVGCLGTINDVSKAITMKIKEEGSTLYLLGERKNALGGSIYFDTHQKLGKHVPQVDFDLEKEMMHAIIDAIHERLLLSCHDISDGGMIACISEMLLGGEADGSIGAEIDLSFSSMPLSKTLFSENAGFVFEVKSENTEKVEKFFADKGLQLRKLGKTTGTNLTIFNQEKEVSSIPLEKLKHAWTRGLPEALK